MGYGPVGRLVDAMLRDAGLQTVVIDLNIDTVQTLAGSGRLAIYGDATRREVLEQAGDSQGGTPDRDASARRGAERNRPGSCAGVERNWNHRAGAFISRSAEALTKSGAHTVVIEEGEVGVALARHVLERRGVEPDQMAKLLAAVRSLWQLDVAASSTGPARLHTHKQPASRSEIST